MKDFLEEAKKEQEILDIGMKESLRAKKERQEVKRVFCIGNGESRIGFDLERLRPLGKIYGCNAIHRDFMPDVLTAVDHGIMHEIYHAGIAQKIPCYFRDWTKVPAMMYETMLAGGLDKLEVDKIKQEGKYISENERNNAKEYVMHGANLKGLVKIKKEDGSIIPQNVNHAVLRVSWIQDPDYSHSLTDIQKPKDLGWACGASAGFIACEVYKAKEVYLIGHDLYSTHEKINNIYKSTRHYTAKENGPTPGINWINQWYTLADWFPDVKFIKINRFNDSRDQVNGPIEQWNKLKNIVYADYSTLDNLA